MTWFDHVLVVLMLVVGPAHSAWQMPRTIQRIESGRPGERTRLYLEGVAILWIATLALLAHWALQSRGAGALGLVWPAGVSLWISVLASAAVVAFFTQQTLAAAKSPEAQAKIRAQSSREATVAAILPRTIGDARAFTALGVTAGICEEILYRGFLLWYLAQFLDRPVAVFVAIVAFGIAHAWQGLKGILGTGIAGGISMAMYLLTGSLLAPIVLHAAVDVGNGRTARHALAGAAA